MSDPSTIRRPGGIGTGTLVALVLMALLAGIGMREPVPADEPRFVLAAHQMVESGQWLFPHRGSELYAEKPPVFMWLQAAAYRLTGHWPVAFLLPSLLAALATLWLCHDLAARLWGQRAARHAALALFVCLQFGLQAKRGQIDMVLVAMTTLSLWALVRYLLLERDWRLLVLGGFAAGLGTVTKGVGFLPLLIFLPWLPARRGSAGPAAPRAGRAWHPLAAAAGFVAGAGLWLAPMLWAVQASHDPALHAYAAEMLWKQTGTRYASAWHHVKPLWHYLEVIATAWLPGALLLPWLLPAWWRRLRRGDRRLVLLLGWSALVLLFFSLSPGKRDVYIFPALPALCVAAAPLLPGLLRRRGPRRVLQAYLWLLAVVALGLAATLHLGTAGWLQHAAAQRDVGPAALAALATWLLVAGLAIGLAAACARRTGTGTALVIATAALWIGYGIGMAPALSANSSSRELMQKVGQMIGSEAELGLLAWREQNLLQADRPATDFGFKRPWHLQWRDAGPWLAANPKRRWLFVLHEAISPCVDRTRAFRAGFANRREWWLVPGTAWTAGCITPPFPEGQEGGPGEAAQ